MASNAPTELVPMGSSAEAVPDVEAGGDDVQEETTFSTTAPEVELVYVDRVVVPAPSWPSQRPAAAFNGWEGFCDADGKSPADYPGARKCTLVQPSGGHLADEEGNVVLTFLTLVSEEEITSRTVPHRVCLMPRMWQENEGGPVRCATACAVVASDEDLQPLHGRFARIFGVEIDETIGRLKVSLKPLLNTREVAVASERKCFCVRNRESLLLGFVVFSLAALIGLAVFLGLYFM